MKKLISLIIACTLVLGLGATAVATGYSTNVTYVGTAAEEIIITVPAVLTAGGDAGQVSVSGAWPSYKTVSISAPASVELTNSMTAATKEATIRFAGIAASGSDENPVSYTENISVNALNNAIFGAWTGTFYYTVNTSSVVAQGTTLTNTSWKFNDNLSSYDGIFGSFDYENQTGWEPFPMTSTIGNESVSYNFWGFSITYLEGIPIFGPVQSIAEDVVFGYTPRQVMGVEPGWYLINGDMLTDYLNGNLTAMDIVERGLTRTTAPTITIGEANRADYSEGEDGDAEYQAVLDALANSAVIAWLRENASVQAYVPAG